MTDRKTDPAQLLKDVGLDWPPELVRAWVDGDKSMHELTASLPHDLPYAAEPGHIFHPTPKTRS